MSSHYATADVWVGNLGSEDEAEEVSALIEEALSGSGYQVTVTVIAHAYAPLPGDDS